MNKGLSLVETIIAVSLLTAMALITIQLFHSGLRLTARVQAQTVAAKIARDKLEEIRGWAADPANFADWSPYLDTTNPAPESGFTVRVRSQAEQIYTPCSTFEASNSQPRLIRDQTRRVEVTVSWSGEQVQLTTLVGAPPDQWGSPDLVVSPATPGPLNPGQSVDLAVQAFDASGQPLDDLFFDWFVQPLTGNGTLVKTNRDGSSARLTHQVIGLGGAPTTAPGTCRVHARAVYRGRERSVATSDIVLNP